MSRIILGTVVVAALAAVALHPRPLLAGDEGAARQPTYAKVVVFGDSLSDPGNVFASTGQYSVRPFTPIPSAPYAIGGFHFTDGETWVERLSRRLGTPTGSGSAVRVPQFFTNFAFGGARARAGMAGASPDLGAQVAMYFGVSGGVAAADGLHVIWVGTNDVRDALEALAVDPSGAASIGILQAAIGAIGYNIGTLWSAGARTFLVPNAPDIALTPAVAAQPAVVKAAAAQLSGAYNAGLAQLLGALQAQLPGVQIVSVDVAGLLASIVAAPKLYGLKNVTEPCLHFGVVADAICSQPRQYLFWDAIHPTAVAHKIMADTALAALAP